MFCQHCGAKLEEGEKFCSNCGAPVSDEGAMNASVPQTPYTPVRANQTTYAEPVGDNGFSKALTIMILAILGLSFGVGFYTSSIGLVLSIIARAMVGSFKRDGYQIGGEGLSRKAKVSGNFAKAGNIVSIIGLIVSIVMLVIFVIYAIILNYFFKNANI